MPSTFDDFVADTEAKRGSGFQEAVKQAEQEFGLSWELRTRRLELGMTQAALAESCGITQSEISRIESGAANPTLQTVSALCASLGVTMGIRAR